MKWYEVYDNLIGLASWLDSECWFGGSAEVIYFMEKPWKWEREYGLWLAWREAETEELRERLCEAIGEEATAEDVLSEPEERRPSDWDEQYPDRHYG